MLNIRRLARSGLLRGQFNCRREHVSTKALRNLLKDEHFGLINEERNLLADLHSALSSLGVSRDKLELVEDTRARIDDLYTIVVVGEFNAGKSTFINSLLGAEYLRSGVLPTTDKICLLRSNAESISSSSSTSSSSTTAPSSSSLKSPLKSPSAAIWKRADSFLLDDVEERLLPAEWLRNVALIDTPGTNALLSRHDELTQLIVPRADLVLFVTSAERPMSDSESKFLDKIAHWGKKVHVVINKMDVLHNSAEKDQVIEFVRSHVSTRLKRQNGQPVPVFPVSARMALQAKLRLDDNDNIGLQNMPEWTRSGIDTLEQHLRAVLGSETLVSSKLGNPLGVCDRLVSTELQALAARQEALIADVRTVELIEENMEAFASDVQRDVTYVQNQLKMLISKHKSSINMYLDEFITMSSMPATMLDMKSLEENLYKYAHGSGANELKGPLDDAIVDISGLVVSRSRAQATAVLRYVGDRHKINERARQFVGCAASNGANGATGGLTVASSAQFDQAGRDLKERMQRQCTTVFTNSLESHEKSVADAVQTIKSAFAQVFLLHSIGVIGATSTIMELVDLPIGALATCVPFLVSYFAIPRARNSIKMKFAVKADKLQAQLEESLTQTLEQQLHTVREHLKSSVAPYERFVAYETRSTDEMVVRLEQVRQKTRDIRSKLENL